MRNEQRKELFPCPARYSFSVFSYPVTQFSRLPKTKRPGLTAQTGPPEGELRTMRSADVTAAQIVPLFGVLNHPVSILYRPDVMPNAVQGADWRVQSEECFVLSKFALCILHSALCTAFQRLHAVQLVEQRLRQHEQLVDRIARVEDQRVDAFVPRDDVGSALSVDAVIAVATEQCVGS